MYPSILFYRYFYYFNTCIPYYTAYKFLRRCKNNRDGSVTKEGGRMGEKSLIVHCVRHQSQIKCAPARSHSMADDRWRQRHRARRPASSPAGQLAPCRKEINRASAAGSDAMRRGLSESLTLLSLAVPFSSRFAGEFDGDTTMTMTTGADARE